MASLASARLLHEKFNFIVLWDVINAYRKPSQVVQVGQIAS